MGRKYTTQEFIEKLDSKYPNEYDVLGKYVESHFPIKIRHKRCGYEWDIKPTNILSNKNKNQYVCPCCNHSTIIKGVNDLWTTNPSLCKLLENKNDGYTYSRNSIQKVNWFCSYCGELVKNRRVIDSYYYGVICKRCSKSKSMPNRIMYNLLSQLNIQFEDEKNFNWCRYYYDGKYHVGFYDFYFIYNNKKYIVEMDGGFHTKDNILHGIKYKRVKEIDDIKDKLAKEHNINVIRIDCSGHSILSYKNQIINSSLSEIIDIDNVNWEKCLYQSCDNKIKECCKLYNNGLTITNIQKEMNLSYPTVTSYLIIGTEGGLCSYYRHKKEREIICLNTKEIFKHQTEAAKAYNAPRSGIDNSCKDRNKSGGKHPITGEKLYWMFFDEYKNEIKGSR